MSIWAKYDDSKQGDLTIHTSSIIRSLEFHQTTIDSFVRVVYGRDTAGCGGFKLPT